MRVLEIASEAVPFAKTGGLADVAGALPDALAGLGCDVSLVIPAHAEALGKGLPVEPTGIEFDVPIGSRVRPARILRCPRPGGRAAVYLVANDDLFGRPTLYGGAEELARAREVLPQEPEILAALGDLQELAGRLSDLPISFDLADLRGYHYHSGVVFAAYGGNSPVALALGGRYDSVGRAFGRGRPATGFSLDLRELAAQVPDPEMVGAILAPAGAEEDLSKAIAALRAGGENVMIELPGHEGTWREAGCDRRLVLRGGAWQVEPLQGE